MMLVSFSPPELALRDLPQDATLEDKFDLICQKYQDLLHEEKEANTKIKQYEQAAHSIRNERDQLQAERNRLILQKDKLETLCRELQKQNKLVQEESVARTRAEEEKRREVADHFQTGITSIQTQLNEYQTRNSELRKENQELADKLSQFIKQHEKREEHVEKLLQARDLEVKLAEAKLNKMQCLLEQERVKSQQKVINMEQESKLMKDRMDMHLELEQKLKDQIEFYKTKYQNFNKTIAKSNKLFDSAKDEMEKLTKRVKQSEHDVVEWRGKWELSQRSLLEVAAENKKLAEEAAVARKQAERMGNLCRALRAQLKEGHQSDTTCQPNDRIVNSGQLKNHDDESPEGSVPFNETPSYSEHADEFNNNVNPEAKAECLPSESSLLENPQTERKIVDTSQPAKPQAEDPSVSNPSD
ncbi:alpha-taxilin [Clonorchis sinensis]|uniref:Alpha-taxilin n=1 Tax=Clonorchis sinensis TaxID=79923 RepID=G7YJD7_CLOSI|nr:alpha-taxilin [Clonorchis sinensis]